MIGIDIVEIKKIKEKKEKFLSSVFTEDELLYATSKKNIYQSLAGIYAGKEAIIKAFDLDLSYIIKKKIDIRHRNNRPEGYINGMPIDGKLTISHEGSYAIAFCLSNSGNLYQKLNKEDLSYMKKILPKRDRNSHKGDYGKLAILGGSEGMSGSIYLSSKASLRSGAGLVHLIVGKAIYSIIQMKCLEQIIHPLDTLNIKDTSRNRILTKTYLKDMDTLVLGPGMGRDKSIISLIDTILTNFSGTIIIDADGLNAISADISVLKKSANLILTPHIKEFERLIKVPIDKINKNRIAYAKKFALENNIILVLKSHETVVTDGMRVYINKLGNPGMATAGSGDVLSGIIGSLSMRLEKYQACVLAVFLHSLAGDLASIEVGEDSLIASDIIDYLGQAFKVLR
ncbi:MAG: NAD(P)H-hydrate dehydratase [Tissierellia bacterium]|nr:NAD(P)H-hydrate dehydratase [Tissierellia bacterium]